MATKEEFIIIVSPNGEIKLEAVGFKGKKCVKPLEEVGNIIAPDTQPTRKEKKSEYYQETEVDGKTYGETKD